MKRHFNCLLPICLLWLYLIGNGRAVAAQSDELSFQSAVSYSFGQLLTFRLTADNITGIETATLFFQAPEFTSTYVSPELIVEEAGPTFHLLHSVELSTLHLAPFTTVTYWWRLQTADGQEIVVPEEKFVYADDQFDWRNLSQGNTIVYWTGEDELGQIALDAVTEARTKLNTFVPVPTDAPLSIYIYPTSGDLRAALRLTGRDWVGAHAAPELNVILVTAVNVRSANTDLRQSLPHEMLHFYLYQAMGANYHQIPAWLNEGLATLVEIVPRPTYESLLGTAVADQSTIPFRQLCPRFPAGEQETVLAYAQSASFIQFIQARYGNQSLRDLLAAYNDGADCASAVERVLPATLDQLNETWLRSLQPRPLMIQFLLENSIWFLLLLVGLGVSSLLVLKSPL